MAARPESPGAVTVLNPGQAKRSAQQSKNRYDLDRFVRSKAFPIPTGYHRAVRAIREHLAVRSAAGQTVGETRVGSPWHFHPEYELILIASGSGVRLIGDHVDNFATGDVVLLGPDLPHSWTSTAPSSDAASAAVLHFTPQVADLVMTSTSATPVHALLGHAALGALITDTPRGLQAELRHAADGELSDLHLLSRLFTALADLAELTVTPLALRALGSPGKQAKPRIEAVCNFLETHHEEPISLGDAAGAAHMSPSAFSRFFTANMGRTFVDYLTEVRIQRARTLLLNSDLPITEIATRSGFTNLSNFNRRFRGRQGLSPTQYRRAADTATRPARPLERTDRRMAD